LAQAHARRFVRDQEELVQTGAERPRLRVVPESFEADLFDSGLFEADLDIPSPGRSRPRRPTGAAADYARSSAGTQRRTVQISGYGAQTSIRPTPSEMRGPRPDRIAAWAVGFAIFLALLAALVGG
jgi:hypothetical protein